MTQTFTWTGAAYQDWLTGTNWSPSGPPTDGSVALITGSAGPQLNAAGTVDNIGILLDGGNAAFALNGGTLGVGATVTVAGNYFTDLRVLANSTFDGNLGFAPGVAHGQVDVRGPAGVTLTIGSDGSLTATTGNGIILESSGTITNNGTLNAAGGLVSLYSGTLNGSGVINISNGGYFFTNKDIGPGQTISFADQTGRLDVYSGATITGPITNFQAGDVIQLAGVLADAATYDPATHVLAVTDQGTTVASFNLFSNDSSLAFNVRAGSYTQTMITSSDSTRVWNGGVADWYDPANWSSTPASPASFPLAGDTVQIDSGTAIVTATDLLQYGSIDAEYIQLTGTSGAAGTLFIQDDTIGPNATIETTGSAHVGELKIGGTVASGAFITSDARNGTLDVQLADGATFINGLGKGGLATMLSGTSSALNIRGSGTFVNNGIVVVQGGMVIGPDVNFTATADGTGNNELIRLAHGGQVTIDGTFENNAIVFGDSSGYVRIANLGGFQGSIVDMTGGDRIDLPNVVVDSVSYDLGSGELTLLNGGTQVGELTVWTLDGFTSFSVKPDKNGGSVISYEPTVHVLQPALPVPLVAAPGSEESLQDLLIQAFGTIPAAYADATFGLSYMTKGDLQSEKFFFWNLSDRTVTDWKVDGTTIPGLPSFPYLPPNPPTKVVPGSDLSGITLQAGNAIMPAAFLSIPIGPTSSAGFYIPTIDPKVASPTIYSGIVDPEDIVASAERFAAAYVDVVNHNDCGWIGDDVAAAAGATMPSQNWSTDPSANVSGGFWRVVYRGSDQDQPAQDWSTLVHPGDIVRMGWLGGGQHTTTVLAVNGDGSIEVYDNDDNGEIGIHEATYWDQTIPSSITIYRLDPNHQFLVQGAAGGEYLQGSPYSNLFQPIGGGDTIAAGAGLDEIEGAAVNLDHSSVLGWMPGDSIDITNLAADGATVDYTTDTGVLRISNAVSKIQTEVTLTAGLSYDFTLAADPAGTGTLVTVSCFASGTRLRTPAGDVAVERLAVGDVLLTRSGIGWPVRWIGRRTIDLRGHPRPRDVQPVRIAPHAFGPQQPRRALVLSPDHAVYFDGALIPVRYLVDGERIVQLRRRSVTYWHVELDRHDVILAENLPVESYLDTGSDAWGLRPDAASRWEAEGCAPLVVIGPQVDAARRIRALP